MAPRVSEAVAIRRADRLLDESLAKSISLGVPWYLMASYLYYVTDRSLLTDAGFDHLARTLLQRWDEVDHWHKYLITTGDLEAGTLALAEERYPLRTISAAEFLYDNLRRG